jgi:hypothetical protein
MESNSKGPNGFNQNEDKSRIEELKKRLFSKQGIQQAHLRGEDLHEKDYGVAEEWRRNDLVMPDETKKGTPFTFIQKLLLTSVIFFVGALAFSIFLFYDKTNTVSADKIELGVTGPVSIGGGEPLSFTITLHNKNNIQLLGAKLTVEYPDGTRSISDIGVSLPRSTEPIGDLGSGAIIQRTEKAVLFGEENDKKVIKILLEYRVNGSNATFSKAANYEISMNASPVRVTVNSVKEISSGQSFDFTIDVASNSTTVVQNVLLKAEYPFGFQFKDASPKPTFDTNTWTLGDIAPGMVKTIHLSGMLQGQDEEERIFKFSTGLQSQNNEKELDTTFTALSQSVIIKKPFLGVGLVLDDDTAPEHITDFGKRITGQIIWTNNLSVPILDATIQVSFVGASLDKSSVIPTSGFYQSFNNTMQWDKTSLPDLSRIEAGQGGRVNFSFASLPLQSLGSLGSKSSVIALNLIVKGNRLGESNVPEQINNTAVKQVKFTSQVSLVARSSHLNTLFSNTGPIPPKAEKETKYTVYFTVLNSSNIVQNAIVTAQLPNYVRWLDAKSPVTEDISYDKSTGLISWNIGDLKPTGGAGRTVAFQVAVLPSISQVGLSPEIVKGFTFVANDQYTKTKIQTTANAVTTTTGDIGAQSIDSIVTN